MNDRPRGSYGIDAPGVPVLWTGLAVLAGGGAALFALWRGTWWGTALCGYLGITSVAYLAGAALYWHATVRGKFRIWGRVLSSLSDEAPYRILDLGCGRGAVAVMAALRYPDAEVVGIDLWRGVDQSGNAEAAARANADGNEVGGRIRLATGDMTDLPFADASFDLITASLSIHNVPTPEGRARALDEAIRVLRPGGRIAIVDIRHAREYADALAARGLRVDGPRRAGWEGWWSGPWMATSVLLARI